MTGAQRMIWSGILVALLVVCGQPAQAAAVINPSSASRLPGRVSSVALSQTANEEAAIRATRARVAAINGELKKYRKVERDLVGFSAEGGSLEAYFAGQQIRKMVARYLGETGQAYEEYYFWERQLIFVFRREVRYDSPFGKVVATSENRFYFNSGRMIRWLDAANRKVTPGRPEYLAKQRELLGRSAQLARIARSPR